ncbi:hypothetical protein HUG17_9265 [Dermatophagoides farinae]|uniref:Chitin-binding type-2 domain-containing protein n=1 Tax=Dermatophagoides farinae TaxID=6954 RepID=A0A9D4NRV8_DERFA|nr:hypothetical protein HUG17_9265 [Dermatophagoides farinae]
MKYSIIIIVSISILVSIIGDHIVHCVYGDGTIIVQNFTSKIVDNDESSTSTSDNDNDNDGTENSETFIGSGGLNSALTSSLMFPQQHQQQQQLQQPQLQQPQLSLSMPFTYQTQTFSDNTTNTDKDRTLIIPAPGSSTGFVCPTPFGRFRYELCEYYYVCFFGYPFLIKCHPAKRFDIRVKMCVSWQQAYCQDVIATIGPPAPIPPGEPPMLPTIIPQQPKPFIMQPIRTRPPPIRRPPNGFFRPPPPPPQQFPHISHIPHIPQIPQYPQYPRPPYIPTMSGIPNGMPAMPMIPQLPTVSGVPMLPGIMKDQHQPIMGDMNNNNQQMEFPMNNQIFNGNNQCPPPSSSNRWITIIIH